LDINRSKRRVGDRLRDGSRRSDIGRDSSIRNRRVYRLGEDVKGGELR